MTPTFDEMIATLESHINADGHIRLHDALHAVLDTHALSMLWEAYRDGYRDKMHGRVPDSTSSAARIIDEIKGAK